MKCIKKLVALTLAAVLALAMLTACGHTGIPFDSALLNGSMAAGRISIKEKKLQQR